MLAVLVGAQVREHARLAVLSLDPRGDVADHRQQLAEQRLVALAQVGERRHVQLGDHDGIPNNYGIEGRWLDSNDAAQPLDGRFMTFVLRGHGGGPVAQGEDMNAASWIRWKGPPGEPMLVVTSNHFVAEHFGMHGALLEMLAFLREGTMPQTECHDNIKSLAMVFGAMESARCGKHIQIVI